MHSVLVLAGNNAGSGHLHSTLSGVIARQPENAVRGVLNVSPESELQGAAAAARDNGLFEQVPRGHAHAGYNVSREEVVVRSMAL